MNIICDLDGTIALDHKRVKHLHKEGCPKYEYPTSQQYQCSCKPGDRDWDSYFGACDTDEPCRGVIALIRSMYISHQIYILSGRSMSSTNMTLFWLEEKRVPYHFLQMRSQDDRTDDHILKTRWADEFDLTPTNTLFVLEDRTRVVEAWRAKGFTCFQVAPGNF